MLNRNFGDAGECRLASPIRLKQPHNSKSADAEAAGILHMDLSSSGR